MHTHTRSKSFTDRKQCNVVTLNVFITSGIDTRLSLLEGWGAGGRRGGGEKVKEGWGWGGGGEKK